jgi:hypothetical protein
MATIYRIIAALLVVFACSVVQSPTQLNHGLGNDGVSYATMAAQCPYAVAPAPFVYRTLAPCMASLLSSDPLIGFWRLDLLALAALLPLLWVWLVRFAPNRYVIAALTAAFIVMWHGPYRFVAFAPVAADPLFWPIFVAALLAADTDHPLWLAALIFIGVLTREIIIALPLALLPFRLRRTLPALISGMLALLLTHALATPTTTYTFIGAAANSRAALTLGLFALALALTFGPLILLPLRAPQASLEVLIGRPWLIVLTMLLLLAGALGGSDMERILFWSAPIVLALAGAALTARPLAPWQTVALVALYSVSARALTPILDFPAILDWAVRHASTMARAQLGWEAAVILLVGGLIIAPVGYGRFRRISMWTPPAN